VAPVSSAGTETGERPPTTCCRSKDALRTLPGARVREEAVGLRARELADAQKCLHRFPRSLLRDSPGAKLRITQNHRMFRVGRDLCGSSGPTPVLKQGQNSPGRLHAWRITTAEAGVPRWFELCSGVAAGRHDADPPTAPWHPDQLQEPLPSSSRCPCSATDTPGREQTASPPTSEITSGQQLSREIRKKNRPRELQRGREDRNHFH